MDLQETHPAILEDDLLVLAAEGNQEAIAELTRRGYRPGDW